MVTFAATLETVLNRAEANGWAGADPYDGLLSRVGALAIPFGPAPRMAVIQATLRSERFRKLTRPRPSINPKGLGLFLGAVLGGREVLGDERAASLGSNLLEVIRRVAVRDGARVSWGYPFPWQSRFLWAPAGTPNAVVSATIGWHVLDWAEGAGAPPAKAQLAREMGSGAALFLSETLHHSPVGAQGSAVSYTTRDRSRIVNVSMLVARLLSRVARDTAAGHRSGVSFVQADRMRGQTARLLHFALSTQREDGTWPYSEESRGGWVDSFHTGFVLEALLDLREMGWSIPDVALLRGLAAYEGFFDRDGGGRFLRQTGSPYDAHSAAQGIVTYGAVAAGAGMSEPVRAEARACALRIARWSLERLWLEDRGYFAYRIERERRYEQEYIRWVQAWMALGMSVASQMERVHELATA